MIAELAMVSQVRTPPQRGKTADPRHWLNRHKGRNKAADPDFDAGGDE
jgi:hypothetical protein